ncbi:MAG: syntaphilin domain-containing protein [Ilumatobacteraceae bacterium]|nr:syntaphilin domain-containing protein [Ilumatobacteraceae bacterium]
MATFEVALQSMELAKALSPKDRQMLQALYNGPEHTFTTMEIAHAMGGTRTAPSMRTSASSRNGWRSA